MFKRVPVRIALSVLIVRVCMMPVVSLTADSASASRQEQTVVYDVEPDLCLLICPAGDVEFVVTVLEDGAPVCLGTALRLDLTDSSPNTACPGHHPDWPIVYPTSCDPVSGEHSFYVHASQDPCDTGMVRILINDTEYAEVPRHFMDTDGDGVVRGEFDFVYEECCDYNCDGVTSIMDLSILSGHNDHYCQPPQCNCPFQGDLDASGGIAISDVTAIQGIVFQNGSDVQDIDCPFSRADWDGSGLVDCRDFAYAAAHLSVGGPAPSDPCTCPPGPPGTPCNGYSDGLANSVVVTSKAVSAGATNVGIPVLLQNPTSNVRGLTVPLVIREVDAGSFVTSVALSYGDRLASLMAGWQVTNQYADAGGSCGPSSFETVTFSDGASHPVTASPEGMLFSWGMNLMMPQPLTVGTDISGSLILTVDVTTTPGDFEIDTACCDPGNHLLFVYEDWTAVRPSFTKGIITIEGVVCDCPYQCDYDEDTYPTNLDLAGLIDVLFGGVSPITDPNCPVPRGDFNFDGYPDNIDLNGLIDQLFRGGDPPCDPCNPVQSTCAD
jgi:hypothetical protein